MSATLAVILFVCSAAAPEADLDKLLHDYFLAPDQSAQSRLQGEILATDGLTPDKLAKSIRRVELWDSQPTGELKVVLQLGKDKSTEKLVWLSVPHDYDPNQRWPLIIALHPAGGNARWMMDYTLGLLKDRASEFIIAAPLWLGAASLVAEGQRPSIRGLGFTGTTESVNQPRLLVRKLRHRFHIDSNRVYLVGYSLGASNTWMGAVMHADCFAGIAPISHVIQIFEPHIFYPELLPNLRNTWILFSWGEKDINNAKGEVSSTGGIAGRSRKMAATIRELGLKKFKTFEMPGAGHRGVVPQEEDFLKLVDRHRKKYPKRIRQTFRLAEQSEAYWVAAESLNGDPLPAGGRLQIRIRPGEEVDAAKRRIIIGSLGRIEGRCKGQKITLRSHRVPRVVLRLSDDLLDLDKKIRILRGKKEVFNGRIERDLEVMLREAARGWDFDRLPVARVVVPVAGRVEFGYPSDKKDRPKSVKKPKGRKKSRKAKAKRARD